MEKINEEISLGAKEHGSIPFWSWNDRLQKDELIRQINDMYGFGMRGFFMHARSGLETEYMSDEWFDDVKTCIDEAKRLGMEAWAYDENGWPSGFAGGELLRDPKNHACSLEYETAVTFPEKDENILGVYIRDGEGVKRINAPCGADGYIVIRRHRDFSYVDTMDPEIAKSFVELTHEKYRERIGEADFGKTMPGFFTDEPQYFRYGTPWSDTFVSEYKRRFGEDVLDGLPAMFIDYAGAAEFRYNYHLLCHEAFYENFMKIVYEWCDKNGVLLTGHGIEEWGLAGQMMCCGGVMPFYLYEHIPGIDYLGRDVKDISGARQLGSVCAQTGRRRALSEMFACCGWDVTPKELKRIAELQFAGGVNVICEHLYPYSERGQRKRDFPCHYSEHNPWHKYFGDFERYFSNLVSALSIGEESADTLVIHPIHSAYLYYKHNDANSIGTLESEYQKLVKMLSENQIPFHFGDETIMRMMGSVDGNKIRIGLCSYDKVVIPYCYTLDSSTVELLREYVKNGGRVYVYDCVPDRIDGKKAEIGFIKSNMSFDELKAASGISIKCNGVNVPLHMQVRKKDGRRIIFIANTSEKRYNNVEISVCGCDGLEKIDLLTLDSKPVRGRKDPDGSVTVLYDFDDSASVLLTESSAGMLLFEYTADERYIETGKDFALCTLPENKIILDKAAVSLNGGEYSETRPIERIRDNLLRQRFSGRLSLMYRFDVETVPEKLLLVSEPGRNMSVKVNGRKAESDGGWRIDRSFQTYDISSLTLLGENTVEIAFDYFQRDEVYRVLYGGGNEALRNCLNFDTEIEAIYLFGAFDVVSETGFADCGANALRSDGPFVLSGRKKTIDFSNIVSDGYPFFFGEIVGKRNFNYKPGDPTRTRLNGRFAVSMVAINGHEIGVSLFSDV
ncbi:MAG: glycosyl hydrolase, partial [Eubacteriales bacterium]